MGTRTGYLALLLAAGVALAPAARAQDYVPPSTVFPLPLYSNRPEAGGLYLAGEFLWMHQNIHLKDQLIATRGFRDADGAIFGNVGQYFGTGAAALRATDVGPSTYTPGYNITGGWRFGDGLAVEISWWHLAEAKMAASASGVPFNFAGPTNLADSFLFAPVFNFPSEYAGPFQRLAQQNLTPPPALFLIGDNGTTYGIWDGAANMTIQFVQRYDQFDITGRIPMFQTDNGRYYGLVGPRVVSFYDQFKWRTVAQGIDIAPNGAIIATSGPTDVANYTNTVSNRLYGMHIGCGDEFRLGDTPAGTFAISVDLQVALMVNFVKEVVKYELGDKSTAAKRSRKDYTLVPELEGRFNLWWYPIEGVQLRVGYDVMAFFNTVASPYPVSFNFGALDPVFDRHIRLLDGLNAGIGFIF